MARNVIADDHGKLVARVQQGSRVLATTITDDVECPPGTPAERLCFNRNRERHRVMSLYDAVADAAGVEVSQVRYLHRTSGVYVFTTAR